MKIKALHPWDVDYSEAIRIQESLKDRVVLSDSPGMDHASILAGADISYNKGDDLFFAAVVALRLPELKIIEEVSHSGRVAFPYIPGLLSFREGPILLKAFKKLRNRPDIILFDGQGIAHPRGVGLASHMGLFLDLPTIGCAKTRLFGAHDEVGKSVGDYSCLKDKDAVIGAALRTKLNVKPVYVSSGHKIGLERAIEVVLASCRGYRLPEPTRQAHLSVNRLRTTAAACP